MFECHFRCLEGRSSQQKILWRLWNGGASWRISTKCGGGWVSTWLLPVGNLRGSDPKVKPKTLNDLKEVVESLDEEEVRRAVRDVRPRAELCIKMDGSHFESQLKKYKRGTIEELKYPVRLPLGTRECLCYVWKFDFIEVIKVLFRPNQMEHTVVFGLPHIWVLKLVHKYGRNDVDRCSFTWRLFSWSLHKYGTWR